MHFPLRFLLGFGLVLSGLDFCFANPLSAQSNEKGPAYVSVPKEDQSYPLMGEFVGPVRNDDNKSETLALQVRAMGDDRFEAIAYWGGLPGHQKHRPEPIQLIGMRSGDFVVLSGGPWAVFVEKNQCRLFDRQGSKVGQLKRVRRKSPTLLAPPPDGAVVLFDGTGTDQFVDASMTEDGLLEEGALVRPMFQDFDLHIEFRLPYMPQATDQQRGNSGLYLQSRYECQVLDSFAQVPAVNGCGALYRYKKPDLNMTFPPLVWQTYDVSFTAPRWAADGTKVRNARISSWVNGVKVQDDVELKNKTGAGKPEGVDLLPTNFQDHGDPVRFRNAWVIDRGLTAAAFPVIPTREQVQAALQAEQAKRKARAKAAKQRRAELKKQQQQDQQQQDRKQQDQKQQDQKQQDQQEAAKQSADPEQSKDAGG